MKDSVNKEIATLRQQADSVTELNSAVTILDHPYLHYIQTNFPTTFIPIDNQISSVQKGVEFNNFAGREEGVIFHLFAEEGERFILDLEYVVIEPEVETDLTFEALMFFTGDGFHQKVDLQLIDGLYSILTPFKQNDSGLALIQIHVKAPKPEDVESSLKYRYIFKNVKIFKLSV